MTLYARQLGEAISRLPDPEDYLGDFYRFVIPDPVGFHVYESTRACNARARILEFKKSENGREWIINSIPE